MNIKSAFGTNSSGIGGLGVATMSQDPNDDIRQFNYYGQVNGTEGGLLDNIDEEDVEKLEREIEEVMKGTRTTANGTKFGNGRLRKSRNH